MASGTSSDERGGGGGGGGGVDRTHRPPPQPTGLTFPTNLSKAESTNAFLSDAVANCSKSTNVRGRRDNMSFISVSTSRLCVF